MRLILLVAVLLGAGYFAFQGVKKFAKSPDEQEELATGIAEKIIPAADILQEETSPSQNDATAKHQANIERLEALIDQEEKRVDKENQDKKPILETKPQEPAKVVYHRFVNREIPLLDDLTPIVGNDLIRDTHSNVVAVKVRRPEELLEVSGFLKLIDVPPVRTQYQVEAVLVTARISRGSEFSIDWLLSFSYPVLPTDSGFATLAPGAVTASGDWFDVAITKARDQGKLAVLSRPRLILATGETATISSGREVPLPVANSQDGNVQTTVEFRPVVLQLDVTVREISGDKIRLDLEQINEQVAGFVDVAGTSVPELASQRWKTGLQPEFGRWYAVGGVVVGEQTNNERFGWLFRNARLKSREVNQVGMFVRVYPVVPEDPPQFVEDIQAGEETVFPIAQPILRAIPIGK